jgi:hypothetical protein
LPIGEGTFWLVVGGLPISVLFRLLPSALTAGARGRVRPGGARAHGLGGADGSRSGGGEGEKPGAQLDVGGADAQSLCP